MFLKLPEPDFNKFQFVILKCICATAWLNTFMLFILGNGLGPAMFGVIFYLFNVDLNDESKNVISNVNFNDIKMGVNITDSFHHNDFVTNMRHEHQDNNYLTQFLPGPPFVLGSLMVVVAILVAIFIKEDHIIDAKRTSIVGEMKSKISFIFFRLCYFWTLIFIILFFDHLHLSCWWWFD